jgi:PIN domain nuclease of toxin-antitoxin system
MDTNVALWSLAAPERLSVSAHDLILDPSQKISFSSISVVEFELKRERLLGDYDKLTKDFSRALVCQGFSTIPFTASDATGLAGIQPNRDPFDRMLSAQAIARNLVLISSDSDLHRYQPLQTVW